MTPFEEYSNGFVVKDSGKREEYPSGMRRDTQDGKPNYLLIDRVMLKRFAEHMTKGAKKYGPRNWERAVSPEELERFKSSAFRHLMQWLDGEQDEDHAAAVYFNIMAAEYVQRRLSEGIELNVPEGWLADDAVIPPLGNDASDASLSGVVYYSVDSSGIHRNVTSGVDHGHVWVKCSAPRCGGSVCVECGEHRNTPPTERET